MSGPLDEYKVIIVIGRNKNEKIRQHIEKFHGIQETTGIYTVPLQFMNFVQRH